MIYAERPSPPALAGVVTRFWCLEATPIRQFEKILPMPLTHVIVNLSAPYAIFDRRGTGRIVPDVFVSGMQSEYLVIESPDPIRHIGFELSPTGLGALVPGAPRTAAGQVLDAGQLIPGLAGLAVVVRDLTDPEAALDAIESYLEALVLHPVEAAVTAAVETLATHTERPIGEIAQRLGVSHRGLIASFSHATGMTPKRFAQLVRFHHLIDAVHARAGEPDWAELAVGAGYYDQPHVIRQFRRFSGWTPTEYYRLVAEHGPDAARFVPLDQVPTQASA
ncbi:helix-turn-helix domain-containing protein [Salana multivorans]